MSAVLEVEAAHHRYGETVAVDGVDLSVEPGECVALLGPNGAGKTTLIGLTTGLLPARGDTRVRVAGGDPRLAATRRHLGVVQQSIGFPRTLKVRELVRGAAVRAGLPARAAAPVIAEVGLVDVAERRAGKLSGGQHQRLQLAMALVADPGLLLLDEPTVGLDVAARRAFWQLLAKRRDRGTGVLLTTHLVEEAGAVADRVVLLHRGRVIASGRPDELTRQLPERTITARSSLSTAEVATFDGAISVHEREGRLHVGTARPEVVLRSWLERDPALDDLRVEGASLEQTLIDLTEQHDRSGTGQVAA